LKIGYIRILDYSQMSSIVFRIVRLLISRKKEEIMPGIVRLRTFFLVLIPLVIFACATAPRPNGEGIADTGKNQNCRLVMDDYGDSETICEPK